MTAEAKSGCFRNVKDLNNFLGGTKTGKPVFTGICNGFKP